MNKDILIVDSPHTWVELKENLADKLKCKVSVVNVVDKAGVDKARDLLKTEQYGVMLVEPYIAARPFEPNERTELVQEVKDQIPVGIVSLLTEQDIQEDFGLKPGADYVFYSRKDGTTPNMENIVENIRKI